MGLIKIYKRISCYFTTSKQCGCSLDSDSIEKRLELKIKDLKHTLKTSSDKHILDSIQDEIRVHQSILANLKKGK
ncbi:MAG: hypothetical protein M0P43_04630 [Arcobacteraceae bacterium]|nr:hypothetical protein [Arcobacteraceae bacterium]MDY0327996.1 hypothetical protein [Arcobacteraceae bacterium]